MFEFSIVDSAEPPRPFPGTRFVIGSGAQAHLRFPAELVQARHVEVRTEGDAEVWVRDLTGRGLTWIDGEPVSEARLEPGARLTVGRLNLVLGTAKELEATAKRPTPFRPSEVTPTPAGTAELVAGAVIAGRYRVLRKLAQGGMGAVYLAEHVDLQKRVAVKVMLSALSQNEEFAQRFKREALAASRIGQQNIIDVSDFGRTAEGQLYFAMEYLEGVTLARVLREEGALPVRRAVDVSVQIARALDAAHRQGIIHRDMKPENVMLLQRSGRPDFVKVLDFGVAKVTSGPDGGARTMLGTVMGTPQYMSPEQAKGTLVDPRTDVYAFGLIIHELLVGRPTFEAEGAAALMVLQVTEPAPPFSEALSGQVPSALERLVFSMLEKDPNARPSRMADVLEVLEAVAAQLERAPETTNGPRAEKSTPYGSPAVRVTGAPVQASAVEVPDEPAPKASRWPLMVGAVVVVALGVGALVLRGAGGTSVDTPLPPPVVVQPKPKPQEQVKTPEVAEPPIAPVEVEVTLVTEPPHAEVLENGVTLGNAPVTLRWKPGASMQLTFIAAGYRELRQELLVPTKGQTFQFKLEPLPKPPPAPHTPPAKPPRPPSANDLHDAYQ